MKKTQTFSRMSQSALTSAEAALTIQCLFRRMKAKKQRTKFRSSRKHRKLIVKEIIDSEANFVADLDLVIDNCYLPLKALTNTGTPILATTEIDVIFTNIVAIRDFARQFLKELQVADCDDPYNKFAHVFRENADSFKLYYPYTASYAQAEEHLQSIRQNNSEFATFLDQIEFTPALKDMDISSFLIKPIQRLTKYPLLLTELLKHTLAEHPDFKNIKEAREIAQKFNEENNRFIEQHLKNMKLLELHESFSSALGLNIYQQDRRFLAEETVQVIKKGLQISYQLYLLSDMLLYSKRSSSDTQDPLSRLRTITFGSTNEPSVKLISLTGTTILKDLSDGKYFKNMFSVVDQVHTETFATKESIAKDRILLILNQVVSDSREVENRSRDMEGIDSATMEHDKTLISSLPCELKIEIHVIGTEDRTDGYKSHTHYIILITYGSCSMKIFKRNSEVLQLSSSLQEQFPEKKSKLIIQRFANVIKPHRTKIIELRKISIENFLQLMFHDEEVRSCEILRSFCKLPEGFFDPESQESITPTWDYDTPSTGTTRSHLEKLNSIISSEKAFNRLSSLSISRNRNKSLGFNRPNTNPNYHNTTTDSRASLELDDNPLEDSCFKKLTLAQAGLSVDYGVVSTPANCSCYSTLVKHPITVYLIDGTSFVFQIHERTTAQALTEQLAEQLGLKIHEDFRLFILEGQERERVLDEDEFIAEVTYLRDELRSKANHSFFSRLKKRIAKALEDHPNKLIFKKYYYLDKEEECERNSKDYLRLKLLVLQALAEVKIMKYDLGYSDYLMLACLGAFNQYLDEIRTLGAAQWFSENGKIDMVLGFIPSKVLATRKAKYWKASIVSYWDQLIQKLDSLISSNKEYYTLTIKALDNENLKSDKEVDTRARSQSACLDKKYQAMGSKDIMVKHLLMNLMWSKSCYGMALYEIEIPYPTEATKSAGWPSGRCLFAVRFKELKVISLNRSQVLVKQNLNTIKSMKCLPVSLRIIFESSSIRIDSRRSFEIYQLIQTYQQLNYFLEASETFRNRSKTLFETPIS